MSVDVQLAKLSTSMEHLAKMFEVHVEVDKNMFEALTMKIDGLDSKLDALMLHVAKSDGERDGVRRMAGGVSAIVSLIITLGGVLVAYFAK